MLAIEVGQVDQALWLQTFFGHIVEDRLKGRAATAMRLELHVVVRLEHIDVVHAGVAVHDVDLARAHCLGDGTDLGTES